MIKYHVKANTKDYSRPIFLRVKGSSFTIKDSKRDINFDEPPPLMFLSEARDLKEKVEAFVAARPSNIITSVFLEEQEMTNIVYDKFIPLDKVVWPDTVPFRAQGFRETGDTSKFIITDYNDIEDIHPDIIAVKLIKPDVPKHILERAREICIEVQGLGEGKSAQSCRSGLYDKNSVVKAAIAGLMNSSRAPDKVDVNHMYGLPKWVVTESGLLPKHAREILKWQGNLNANYCLGDFLERKVGNRVLAVRNYCKAGQRVVLPSGHSLKISKAKEIYAQIKTYGKIEDCRIEVGELTGGRREMRNHPIGYLSRTKTITIGCQKIPFQALADLAEKLDWSEKCYAY